MRPSFHVWVRKHEDKLARNEVVSTMILLVSYTQVTRQRNYIFWQKIETLLESPGVRMRKNSP